MGELVSVPVDRCILHKAGIQSEWGARCLDTFLLSRAVVAKGEDET